MILQERNTRRIGNGLLCAPALALLFLAACSDNDLPSPPKAHPELLLEIYDATAKGEHELALVKIERLRAIEKTSVFLSELEAVERNNAVMERVNDLVGKGDFSTALKVLEAEEIKNGKHEDMTEAKEQLAQLMKVDSLLRDAQSAHSSAKLKKAVSGLHTAAKNIMISQKIQNFIQRKESEVTAMQMAENVVLSGKRAVFFSAEMSRAMIAQRFFSSRGVSASRARSGNLMDGDWDLASTALQDAQKLKNLIIDAKSSSINGIFSRVYREKFCEGLDFCIVDYLQILSSVRRYDSRNLEVAATSAALKSIAKEALIPIVVLSQLSRDSEKRVGADRYPRLSDLRDSGGIEQDADVVALLSEAMDTDAERVAGPAAEWLRSTGRRIVRIEIAKNRNGPTGVIYMVFDGSMFRFVPIEESFVEGNFGGENAYKVEK